MTDNVLTMVPHADFEVTEDDVLPMSNAMHIVYIGFLKSGFSEDQSIHLTGIYLSTLIRSNIPG